MFRLMTTVILLICLKQFVDASEILISRHKGTTLESPRTDLFPHEFNIEGEVVIGEPRNACKPFKNPSILNGTIVLVFGEWDCAIQTKADNVLSVGGVGMIFAKIDGFVGQLGAARPRNGYDKLIPAVEISRNDGRKLENILLAEETLLIRLEPTEPNKFLQIVKGGWGISVSVILGGLALACGTLSIYKIYHFTRLKGVQFNVAQVCLFLELIAAIIRFAYMLDPFRGWNIYNDFWNFTFVTVTDTLTLTTTLMITFYWMYVIKSLTEASRMRAAFGFLRIPFAFVVLILWVLDVIFLVLRMYGYGEVLITISVLFNISVNLLVSILFFIAGYKIHIILRRQNAVAEKKRDKITRVTMYIIASSIASISRIIFLLMWLTPLGGISNEITLLLWFFIFGSLYTISLAQILAFQPPSSPKKKPQGENSQTMSQFSAIQMLELEDNKP